MTDDQIIIAIAKLDGFEVIERGSGLIPFLRKDSGLFSFPHYLTSRDAIIPVIEKQGPEAIKAIVGWLTPSDMSYSLDEIGQVLLSTPRQLCIALLKATNNWKE